MSTDQGSIEAIIMCEGATFVAALPGEISDRRMNHQDFVSFMRGWGYADEEIHQYVRSLRLKPNNWITIPIPASSAIDRPA